MVLHVIHALELLRPERTALVVGHGAEQVTKKVQQLAPAWANVAFVEQVEQNGTGDAAAIGMTAFSGDDYDDDDSIIVVLPGDTPLLRPETLAELVEAHVANRNAATLLTSVVDDPTGYGRVIRKNNGQAQRIVEHRDASIEELDVHEICTSIYAFRRDLLGPALRKLTNDNAQGEYYLTDVVSVLAEMGHRIGCVQAPADETQGVNDRWQLALAERELRSRTNRHWLLSGVTMLDPRQTFIDVTVRIGRDVTLYPGTMLQGSTVVGDECEVGPDTRLVDCSVGDGATVAHTVGTDAEVGQGAVVGPYAHLPAGSSVPEAATTGAFYTAPIG
jgi:bifunctional UDP-N-acetylglucosamine pyrophosphorylase/glucosamine-1-phosphate N-acetyltransferase